VQKKFEYNKIIHFLNNFTTGRMHEAIEAECSLKNISRILCAFFTILL
jgi:hypothetical protein